MSGSARTRVTPLFVLLLGSIIAIGPMTIDLYLPAFPELTDSLGTSESMVHLTLTACLVGLAIGQAFTGPLSDSWGRRRPLLIGLTGYTGASVLCAIAPTAEILTGTRLVQGLTGAAGLVIAQALVRDLVEGPMVARVLSRLLLVMGVAPILAPTLGGQLLYLTGWRGLFWVLAVFGAVMTVVIAAFVPETLAVERRSRAGLATAVGSYRRLIGDRRFLGYVAICALGFVAIFGYVSGSPFVYQEVYGVSPQAYGLLFGLNSVGMVIASQVNARLVLRVQPFRVLARAAPVAGAAAVALVLFSATGAFGLAGFMVPLFVVMTSFGLILPNGGALALNRHPESAGTAAALLGSGQFIVGAFAGPVIGALQDGTALPMAGVMAVGAVGLLGLAVLLSRADRSAERSATSSPVA